MNEYDRQNHELEPLAGLEAIIGDYFPEDEEFLTGMDDEDKLGAVYGQLLEAREDPDEIFQNYGISEEDDE